MADDLELHERLLLAMRRAGISQKELGRRIHTDTRVLRRYLNGDRRPAPELLAACERALDLSEGSLSGLPPSSHPDQQPRPTEDPSGPVEAPGSRRRWRWAALTLASVLVAALGLAAWWRPSPRGSGSTRPDAVPCPAPTSAATFRGRTFKDGVIVRKGASQDFPFVTRLVGNCDVGFRAFCIGQPVVDVYQGSLDDRWFLIAAAGPLDGRLVASGVIVGGPDVGTQPIPCPGGRTLPSSISMSVSDGVAPGDVHFSAEATGADIVGFAVLAPIAGGAPGDLQWQQVALDQSADDGFAATWRSGGPDAVVIAAVVCMATDAPTSAQALVSVSRRPDGRIGTVAASTVDPGVEGRRTACRFPSVAPTTSTTAR
jgi:transcriptional regulator with XRE-family HTH domain